MAASDRIDELKRRFHENPRRFFASLANEYRKAGDLEQAITLCQTHLAEQPGNMNGHVVYGQALFEAGRYDDAKTTFETALTLDPENLIALRHLGDIACQNGANDEAREWYKRVLDADPRNDEIIALLDNLEAERKKDALGAPAASASSMTPVANQAVAEPHASAPTPVLPIEAIDAVVIPAATSLPSRASRESISLMDISLDFESNTVASAPDETPAAPQPAVASDFPAFEEVSLGTPLEVHDTVVPIADLEMTSFAAPEPVELEPWNPPVVDLTAPANEPEPVPEPVAEHVPEPVPEPVPEHVPEHVPEPAAPDMTGDMLFGDSVPAEPAPPFVTETMAELYLQQGFTAEALDVYRQLSATNPDDESLKQRVRKLERGDRSSLSLDVVHQEHSARSYFFALANRRAVQTSGRGHAAIPEPTAPKQSPSEAPPAIPSISNLDSLFSGAPISPEDESMALAFSQVSGAVEMGSVAVKGRPTAKASNAFSLDSVFREADARVPSTTPVTRQSQTLRFDQFFATAGEEPAAPLPPADSAPAGEPGSPAELQQFQSWLGGLKKP